MNGAETIAISARIRLARNIEGYPFPLRLTGERQAKEIIRLVSSGLSRLDGFSQPDDFKLYYMDGVSEEEALSLIENHLISPNLLDNPARSAAFINTDKSISIMINEEDHLREQCIIKGADLRLAYEALSKIDAHLSKSMKFAFDEQLGFLTACPTNLGTGLRASVMMFLPATTINGVMPDVIKISRAQGLTVRGVYGEGSEAEGYAYQISNELTLGITEEEILKRVEEFVGKVCELEECERRKLKNGSSALEIRDRCMRSYGILTNCARLTTEELVKLCANVKLGACLGYVNISDVSAVDELTVKMRPSNITAAAGRRLTASERDAYRAQYVAKYLNRITDKQ